MVLLREKIAARRPRVCWDMALGKLGLVGLVAKVHKLGEAVFREEEVISKQRQRE